MTALHCSKLRLSLCTTSATGLHEGAKFISDLSVSIYEMGDISVFVIGYMLLYILKIPLAISRGLASFFFYFT